MNDEEREQQAARMVSQMDQAQAAFAGIGTALAKMYQALREGGVPRRLAGAIVLRSAHEWARGTFTSA